MLALYIFLGVIIFIALWLRLGYLGSRLQYRHHLATYQHLRWTRQDERDAQLLIFLGPINLFTCWEVYGHINDGDNKKDGVVETKSRFNRGEKRKVSL